MRLREEMRIQQQAAHKNQKKQIQQMKNSLGVLGPNLQSRYGPIADQKLDKVERIEIDAEETEVMKLKFPVALNLEK